MNTKQTNLGHSVKPGSAEGATMAAEVQIESLHNILPPRGCGGNVFATLWADRVKRQVTQIALAMMICFLIAGDAQAPVEQGRVAVARVPAIEPEELIHASHNMALAWYGVVNVIGLIIFLWVRRSSKRPMPKCLLCGSFGAGLWLSGACTGEVWLTVGGVVLLCVAKFCDCTSLLSG